jgi:heparin binding hemagglutinin HbhA
MSTSDHDVGKDITMATKIWTDSDTKALYAVAGVGDLAVEKLRTVPGKLAELRANDVYSSVVTKANELYGDLATRGESVVGRIRRQQASRDLAEQAEVTVRRAKATVSSARATGSKAVKAADRGADKVG